MHDPQTFSKSDVTSQTLSPAKGSLLTWLSAFYGRLPVLGLGFVALLVLSYQIKASALPLKRIPRPVAEYKNPLPIHQAIQSASEVRIYGDHLNHYQPDWDASPFAVLSSHSHKEMFHLLKTTSQFGEFGVKTIPTCIFIFVIPGHKLQGYYFNGRLSKTNILGETAILPDRFTAWVQQYSSP
jgi:hypothetical protein